VLREALQQRWTEVLLATSIVVGLGATVIDACCFPHSFQWAHLAAILIALVAYAFAGLIACETRLLGERVRARLRVLGVVSLLVVCQVGSAARHSGLKPLMKTPSAGRTFLISVRGLLDRDGDGFSPWLGGGDCDDHDPRAYPLSTVGRDCFDVVPDTVAPAEVDASPTRIADVTAEAAPKVMILITIDAFRCGFGRGERAELRDLCPHLTGIGREGWLQDRVLARAPHTLGSLSTIFAYRDDDGLTPLPGALRRRGYRTKAITTHLSLLRIPRLRGSFDDIDESLAPSAQQGHTTTSEDMTTKVIETVREAARSRQPLFVWAHYFDTHGPFVQEPGSHWAGPRLGAYAEEVRRTDRAIGRLVSSLKELVPNDDLALFVTADHGEEFGEHGGQDHGRTLYEEVVRVPFLAWRTGTNPRWGLPSSLPAGSVDMAPYVMSVVTHMPFSPTQALLMAATPPNDAQIGVVYGDLKYINHPQLGFEELFDLRNDPLEKRDLIAVDAESRATLRRILGELLRREQLAPTTL
jgi:Sulfatase